KVADFNITKDDIIYKYISGLIDAERQGDTRKLSRIYYEFGDDQYYYASPRFYYELELEEMHEFWKLIKEAVKLNPFNMELRSHLIGLMYQSGGAKRHEMFQEIKEA